MGAQHCNYRSFQFFAHGLAVLGRRITAHFHTRLNLAGGPFFLMLLFEREVSRGNRLICLELPQLEFLRQQSAIDRDVEFETLCEFTTHANRNAASQWCRRRRGLNADPFENHARPVNVVATGKDC